VKKSRRASCALEVLSSESRQAPAEYPDVFAVLITEDYP